MDECFGITTILGKAVHLGFVLIGVMACSSQGVVTPSQQLIGQNVGVQQKKSSRNQSEFVLSHNVSEQYSYRNAAAKSTAASLNGAKSAPVTKAPKALLHKVSDIKVNSGSQVERKRPQYQVSNQVPAWAAASNNVEASTVLKQEAVNAATQARPSYKVLSSGYGAPPSFKTKGLAQRSLQSRSPQILTQKYAVTASTSTNPLPK